MRAEEHGVDAQRGDHLVGDWPHERIRAGDHTAGHDHLDVLGFERLHELGHGNRVREDRDAVGALRFEQVLGEHVGGRAAADRDHIAGRDVLDRALCNRVLEPELHLRFDGEQRLAQQRARGDGAAVDALEQAFVGQIGDVAADRHGRDTEFLRKRGDAHRTARTQAAQDQMLTL